MKNHLPHKSRHIPFQQPDEEGDLPLPVEPDEGPVPVKLPDGPEFNPPLAP